jgi:hypothetical protein
MSSDMSEPLLLRWTCAAGDQPNMIKQAVEVHPEPDRVRRLMSMGAVKVYAWGNEEGDVTAMIKPLVPLELAEAHGLTKMPNRVQSWRGASQLKGPSTGLDLALVTIGPIELELCRALERDVPLGRSNRGATP